MVEMMRMLKKIIFYVLLASIFTYSLQAKEFKMNSLQKNYVQTHNPELLKNYENVKSYKDGDKVFAIFLFASSSMPLTLVDIYMHSMSKLNKLDIKNGIFFRGLNKKTYEYINKSLNLTTKKTNYAKIATSFQFDPDYFEKNVLRKVPLMSLSLCDKANAYPSECETLFTIRGIANAGLFIDKIIENNQDYSELLKY